MQTLINNLPNEPKITKVRAAKKKDTSDFWMCIEGDLSILIFGCKLDAGSVFVGDLSMDGA
ncbi:hypothetical protein ACLOJK_039871 [Asimina triloba]